MAPFRRTRAVLQALTEDVRDASQHLVVVTWGGSPFVPRSVRRALFRALGADMRSAPGSSFTLLGAPRNLRVGEDVYFNHGVLVEAKGAVTIGAGSALGMEAMIVTSHHPVDGEGRWHADAVGRPVEIGERVWVGARALVLPGTVIESDVVVAAGAVVRGRCTSGGLYAGVPARRVREHLLR